MVEAGGCLSFIALVALLLAIVAYRRTRSSRFLNRRIEELEDEVRDLRRLVEGTAPPAVIQAESDTAPLDERLAAASGLKSAVDQAPARPASAVIDVPAPALDVAPPEPSAGIDWERLFGVRGAAVLGGVALALAGLLFFKYSIEQGLIPPWLRVALGALVGVGSIAGSESLLRRRYVGTANALTGAGIVVLYATIWAASARYGLIPLAAGFALMMAVTGVCTGLAARYASLEIALLGLVGGFATPLLVSSGSDHPIGLFGYILLLDVALVVLSEHRRWPALTLLSLAGTIFYQALWIFTRMGPDRLGLGLVILGVFAVLFAVAGGLGSRQDAGRWNLTSAAAVVAPFTFAVYFAADADFGPQLSQVAALLVLLSLAAGWLARVQGPPALALGAAAASLGVVTVWVLARTASDWSPWEIALWSVAIALAFHVFVERAPERADADGPAPAAILSAAGFLALLALAPERGATVWPWIAGWGGLAALLIRHGGFPGREVLHLAAALGVALGFAEVYRAEAAAPWFPPLPAFLALLIAASLAFHVVALIPRPLPAQRQAGHAAALVPVAVLLMIEPTSEYPALPWLGGTLVLGLLAALAATRLGIGAWLLAAVAATAMVHGRWTDLQDRFGSQPDQLLAALAVQGLAVALFTAWPFVGRSRFRADRFAWPAAALAGPAWFPSLERLFELRFGDEWIGLLPVALALVSLLAAMRARNRWPREDPVRRAAMAWFTGVALGFAIVAVPLQFEREWITLGWALEGLAVIAVWIRVDHPGLKYVGVALLAAVTIRLVANPAVLDYYPRSTWRIVNWLLYTYLVPAAALFAASRVLGGWELVRARPWERARVYARGWPWGAIGTGFAGLLVIFAWINLAVADWFATGERLSVTFARLPERDLTTSIAWALYALVLLALGVARRSMALRWASLGLLCITIAKVFLHDLGELRDLYRVASLLGLAVSLILVSLAYQRFVFRNAPAESG